jgi:hypothetical protein
VGVFKKLFLVREIISRAGVVHFRRYRFLETPWLRVYLHQILESDKDGDLHDHPWSFFSLILKGHYEEKLATSSGVRIQNGVLSPIYSGDTTLNQCTPGSFNHRRANQPHCLNQVFAPTWTLVLAYGKRREWGYQTPYGWIDNKTYRKIKNTGRDFDADRKKQHESH